MRGCYSNLILSANLNNSKRQRKGKKKKKKREWSKGPSQKQSQKWSREGKKDLLLRCKCFYFII